MSQDRFHCDSTDGRVAVQLGMTFCIKNLADSASYKHWLGQVSVIICFRSINPKMDFIDFDKSIIEEQHDGGIMAVNCVTADEFPVAHR